MTICESDKIRNIAVLGHSGSGKSILKDAILFSTNISDVSPIYEKATNISSDMNLFTVNWKGFKYNFIDTPGYADFYGEVVSGMSPAAGAIIIVDGTEDLQVGTDKALEITDEMQMPKLLFVNKIDSENADYYKILDQLRQRYGKKVAPFHVPIGESDNFKGYVNVVELFAREYDREQERCFTVDIPKEMDNQINEVREMLMESVAESDETLLEKYFTGEEFSRDEIHLGLKKAVMNGDIIPVLVGSTLKNIGVHTLMWMAKDYYPSPVDNGFADNEGNFAGQVFKTVITEEGDKVSILKVLKGKLSPNLGVYNVSNGSEIKIKEVYSYTSGILNKIEGACSGDLVAIVNVDSVETGDTLSVDSDFVPFRKLVFPKAQALYGIVRKSVANEKELIDALKRVQEEDRSLELEVDEVNDQIVIGTQGELHAKIIIKKLMDKFNIEAEIKPYKIPYKETIKSEAKADLKLNRQVDGKGEFAQVSLELDPIDEGNVFVDLVQGGKVPPHYTPYIEEGVGEAIKNGILAGYPVINVKTTYFDGEFNPADSNEAVFKEAGKLAFNKAMSLANPTLLEPIMSIRVTSKEEHVGDIMGDITKRRGKILGMEPADDMMNQTVIAEVPQSELADFLGCLRSMTSGRGFFDMEFLKYSEVPEKILEKIIRESNGEDK